MLGSRLHFPWRFNTLMRGDPRASAEFRPLLPHVFSSVIKRRIQLLFFS
jgi:hypothetical protein